MIDELANGYPLIKLASPFLVSFIIYLLLFFLPIHKWRKIHLTVQWSALFYVYGVIILVDQLFEIFILSYILILFIIFLAIHVTVQWKKDVTISLKKAIILLLRIVFLLFFVTYIILLILYGIRFFA